MKTKITLIAIMLLGIFISFLFQQKTYAVEVGAGNFKTEIGEPDVPYKTVDSAIKSIFDAVITIAEIAFIILFLVGGIMYLTSTGNEDQAGKARKLIIDAIIGLIIVLAAWAVSNWIIAKLEGDSTSTSTTGAGSSAAVTDAGSATATDSLPTANNTATTNK